MREDRYVFKYIKGFQTVIFGKLIGVVKKATRALSFKKSAAKSAVAVAPAQEAQLDVAPEAPAPKMKAKSKPKAKSAVRTKAEKKLPVETLRKSGREIQSERASQVLSYLKENRFGVVSKDAEVSGKKSLAWVLWALGSAQKADMREGLSVHDVSALLSSAADIEVFPINISRMIHDHDQLFVQASQERRTKRYLLTEAGQQKWAELPTSEVG